MEEYQFCTKACTELEHRIFVAKRRLVNPCYRRIIIIQSHHISATFHALQQLPGRRRFLTLVLESDVRTEWYHDEEKQPGIASEVDLAYFLLKNYTALIAFASCERSPYVTAVQRTKERRISGYFMDP
eukprot:scaffold15301_cov142-Cylindrotheca_fusiformis.AAC.10